MAHYYMCPGCKSVGKLHPIISCVRVWGVCCCAVLLKHGSDVNAVTRNGWTPLHSSSRYRHLEAARLLLGHGAEVGFETTGGETALHLVSGEGNLELGSLLHDCGAGMNGQSIYSRNPLYLALVYGHLGVAQSLLKHGADSTIQYVSSLYEHAKVAQRLLELGADVNARNDRGRTPLQVVLDGVEEGWAALQAERDQVVQLLQHSAESTK